MVASRTVRFACIGAVAALAVTVAYWALLWSGGPARIEPSGGHDGVVCRVSSSGPTNVEREAFCGLSMTIAFAMGLVGMVVSLGAGAWALATGSRRAFWVAGVGSASAFGLVSVEALHTFTDGGAAGLGRIRGPIHAAVLLLAMATFFRAARAVPRNPETAPSPSPASE